MRSAARRRSRAILADAGEAVSRPCLGAGRDEERAPRLCVPLSRWGGRTRGASPPAAGLSDADRRLQQKRSRMMRAGAMPSVRFPLSCYAELTRHRETCCLLPQCLRPHSHHDTHRAEDDPCRTRCHSTGRHAWPERSSAPGSRSYSRLNPEPNSDRHAATLRPKPKTNSMRPPNSSHHRISTQPPSGH